MSSATSELIAAAMTRPGFYGDPLREVEVRETHISWVFLAGDRAYKLKKPVVFGFVDYSTAERRRRFCEREVRLNRRLALDVYLGVRAIIRTGEGFALGGEDVTPAVDHVVEMRRFDEDRTLSAIIEKGRVRSTDIDVTARCIAAFHRTAETRHAAGGEVAHIEHALAETFDSLAPVADMISSELVSAAERFAAAFLTRHEATLEARALAGRVRDCHGDLRAEHVVLEAAEPSIVDCVEFDSELRAIDVGADLAFLVMDLTRLRRADLGRELVRSYRLAGGAPGSDQLIAFYAATRAWVRAKVACLRADQTPAGGERDALFAQAGELIALGERFCWQARGPLVVVVCGVPASGKSYLARALARASGLPVLSTDETRKRLLGIAPTAHAPQAAYEDAHSTRTYTALGQAAADAAGDQGGVIVDGTFRRRADREAFRSGFSSGDVSVHTVECRAPTDVLRARSIARLSDPANYSDADEDVVARLTSSFEPLEEIAPGHHLTVDTDRVIEDVLDDVRESLNHRLAATPPNEVQLDQAR
jgi:uncharacterized protein